MQNSWKVVSSGAGWATGWHAPAVEKAFSYTCQLLSQFFDEHEVSAPGCVRIDSSWPDCNGLESQERHRHDGVERLMIGLTGNGDGAAGVQTIKVHRSRF